MNEKTKNFVLVWITIILFGVGSMLHTYVDYVIAMRQIDRFETLMSVQKKPSICI